MNCPVCGSANAASATNCSTCGSPFSAAAVPSTTNPVSSVSGAPLIVQQQGGYLTAARPFTVTFDGMMSEILLKTSGWLKFFAILGFIYSGLMCLMILALNPLGPIIGGLGIWMSILQLNISAAFRYAALNADGESLLVGHRKLKTLYTAAGILTIVMLSLMVVAIIVMIALGATLFRAFRNL